MNYSERICPIWQQTNKIHTIPESWVKHTFRQSLSGIPGDPFLAGKKMHSLPTFSLYV